MGKNNRQRRAAKQRKRREQGRFTSNGQGSAGFHDEMPCNCPKCAPPTLDLICDVLLGFAYDTLQPTVNLREHATALAHPAIDPLLVDTAVQTCLDRGVRTIWEYGWQPRDADELAKRRLEPVQRTLLIDAIAAEARGYAPSTVDPRWQAQLEEIGASMWWRPDRSHFRQWAARHFLDRHEAIATAILTLAFCHAQRRVRPVLPLPGSARADDATTRPDVDEKMLARIRALLAKAESTEFPDEAEALSSKAQELMTRFSLDRALLDADRGSEGDRLGGASARRIWLEAPYVSAKSLLVDAVASANRCRLVTDKTGFVTVVGNEVDLELVEILTTSLLLQANRAMLAHGSQVSRYGQSRTRSWRQSFLVSYATRIGQRLSDASAASQAAVDAEDSARLLPALVAREEHVDALYTELFPHTVERSVAVSNAAGWEAGRVAADLATLDSRTPLAG